jgi:hypothetical protein
MGVELAGFSQKNACFFFELMGHNAIAGPENPCQFAVMRRFRVVVLIAFSGLHRFIHVFEDSRNGQQTLRRQPALYGARQ